LTIKKAVKRDGVNLLQQKNMPHVLSLNRELIESGNKIMVHSEYARQKILNDGIISPDKVAHINLIRQIDECESILIDRDTLFSKYNVPTDAIIVSSFGFIDDTKKNVEVCRSIKRLSNSIDSKICYVMVGDGAYADNELQSGIVIKTGFTELEEFNSFISYSDIVVNMRYPSMGETSGALLRILQMGKPCITNNGGWFSEIPDDCVYKINVENVEDELCDAIRSLIEDKDKCKEVGEKAKNYITEYYSAEVISEKIRDFLDGKNL
jgi:glycosyltransferase involved in cell wall biosynthesis